MRLLQYTHDGEFCVTDAIVDEDTAPPYAILSHTWGTEEEEEVTFDDIASGVGKSKPGYKKIQFCWEQARQDGFQYLWIDTCCIDKKNKAELSHSIQSMFRWYQTAAKCYVYLSDVTTRKRKASNLVNGSSWEDAFRSSRWFNRGWTLQELLAPSSVEFFSREGERLGDKTSLKEQIHRITNIPLAVLEGTPLSQFSVNERLRWKEHRETKREEDGAYSLLGIFNIDLAPIYGEGAAGAFKRLMDEIEKQERCTQDLRSTDPRDDKKRIEDTKGGLLKDSYRWILDNSSYQQWLNDSQSRLLWIKGDPGKGKTMLLCGVIDELQKSMPRTALVSYFFCQATDSRINSAASVLRGLLYMLIRQQPVLIWHVRKKHNHAGKAMFEDANAWVALTETFTDLLHDPGFKSTYLVIDALDECITDLPKLLDFIGKHLSDSSRVKWIISSRNSPDIEDRLERASYKTNLSLELNAKAISTAVGIYIQKKVERLAQDKNYDVRTKDAVLEYLASNANDTFLWVALVCQNLEGTTKRHVLKKLATLPPGLDFLYKQMMHQMNKSDDAEVCKRVLASATILYRPVNIHELAALVDQLEDFENDPDSVREIISLCGSFLTVREDTVYFVHQSAKDFLLAKAHDEVFPHGSEEVHQSLFLRSLGILSRTLKRDIYDLKEPGYAIENVQAPDPDPLGVARYPCIYWVDHLCDSNPESSVNNATGLQFDGAVDLFLREKYLYWLEGLSLCKNMPKGVVSMAKLQSLVQGREDLTDFNKLVDDAHRFITYHRWAIASSPLQTYASGLIFSPTGSLIRRYFEQEEPKNIVMKPETERNWGACLQTLEGHSGSVAWVVFSHDSTLLASASDGGTVIIWDTSSWECLWVLEDHSQIVNSVAFSHDSTLLAWASEDSTVAIWDTKSWECLWRLNDHNDSVRSIAFSDDSTLLASASRDGTVMIWNTKSWECSWVLEGHSAGVNSVVFSHDSKMLASASIDSTVMIWDTNTWKCSKVLKGHTDNVTSVAFSHDSTLLASASWDGTVMIWNVPDSRYVQRLLFPERLVTCVVFSLDSTRLVSCGGKITLWDVDSGTRLLQLREHSGAIQSVAFSHNSLRLASASLDKTIKILALSDDGYEEERESHGRIVWSVAFSHDSTRLVSASSDTTIRVWDATSGECLDVLMDHKMAVRAVTFSHDSKQLVSASEDGTIKIWDVNSWTPLRTLEGYDGSLCSVALSHDSAQLASGSTSGRITIWDTHGWNRMQKLAGHSRGIGSLAFSHDLKQLASASWDLTVKIWDIYSGECTRTFNVGQTLYRIAFDASSSRLDTERGFIDVTSPSSTQTASISEHPRSQCKGAQISPDGEWILSQGKRILWMPSEYRPSSSALSGSSIAIGAGSGKVWICHLL